MKLLIYIIVCFSCFNDLLAQSVIIQPNAFQLPRLAQNPACTVADKGKQVFNTTQNKVFYCNGTVWINAENGAEQIILPAFGASNFVGQELSTTSEVINFTVEDYDIANNFNPNDAVTYPNFIVSPDNGIYELKLSGRFRFEDFVPTSSTRLRIGVLRYGPNSSVLSYFEFPVRNYEANTYFEFSKTIKIPAGQRVGFSLRIVSPPTSGSLIFEDINLNGHLISWY